MPAASVILTMLCRTGVMGHKAGAVGIASMMSRIFLARE